MLDTSGSATPMANDIRFIELKTSYQDNGPAWICRVQASRSGRTVYFANRALKRSPRCIKGNHFDLESGEEYWVSGVKKDGRDRHWAGSGKIRIERSAVDEYLELCGLDDLDASRFELCDDLPVTDIERLSKLENASDDDSPR